MISLRPEWTGGSVFPNMAVVNAGEITRQSKSNLALAFVSLGKERRRAMTIFYAFCRVIDDIVDDPGPGAEEKERQLQQWRTWVRGPTPREPAVAAELRTVMARYQIAPAMLAEIIDGVEMDLTHAEYQTWEELRLYCYRVASAVGLVSIEIFGYRNPRCREYAVALGLALQTTNIIRDVGTDLRNGRIYLPQEDLARFQYSAADLRAQRHDERFLELMQFQAARAHGFFEEAAALLPPEDRRAMVAAEIMGSIYRALLRRIEGDGFQVFTKNYRLSKAQKLAHILRQFTNFR